MTRDGVARLLAAAQEIWGAKRSAVAVDVWLELLDDIDDATALAAVRAHARDADRGRYPVTVADIVEYARRQAPAQLYPLPAQLVLNRGNECPWMDCPCPHTDCDRGWMEAADGYVRCPICRFGEAGGRRAVAS